MYVTHTIVTTQKKKHLHFFINAGILQLAFSLLT